MMIALSLMTAIFWGQLSNCETIKETIDQYSCTQKAAYGAVCAFASILFILQTLFFGALIGWRSELIDDTASYDNLGGSFSGSGSSVPGGSPYEQVNSNFSPPPQPNAIDL